MAQKPLILASASPQRKKLMELLGLPFSIQPSRAAEIQKITSTCVHLVEENAKLKARDVAARNKNGVVIGCDTVVYVGHKKIIGKPRDLAEAKRNLKLLMSHPHWVYSGLSVIDVASGKEIVDYEKTKIFMTRIPDAAIDRYYRHMSPLDKAGGFDIEGRGSVFIRRIEGCYFNVVGLPVAKLSAMLKKVGVTVLTLVVAFGLAGCTTEYNLATKSEETTFIGSEKEKSIGAAMAQDLEKQEKVVADVDINERVDRITRQLADVCDRKDLVYTTKVLDQKDLNAVSLPGGYIYVFKGLVDELKTDDELAGVIAHEIGHITARHAIKRMQAMYGFTLLQAMSVASRSSAVANGTNAAVATVFLAYAREDEYQADELGVKYMKKAGFKVEDMAKVLKVLKDHEEKEGPQPLSYWRTHPYLTQRIANVDQTIRGRLEFKDYLNLTGEEK